MADLITMLSAAAGAGEKADPNFNQTVLLLHGDGTNGAQNNTFLDSSTNNFTITRNGNTTQGTFSPFSAPDGRWSNYFNSTTQQLRFADSTAFDLANDFTIEFWVYPTAVANNPYFVCLGDTAATNNGFLIYYSNATASLRFYVNGAAVLIGSSLSNNQWYHVAVVRSGGGTNNLKMYLNGVQDAQATNTVSYTGVAGNGFAIGAEYNSGVFGGNGWFYMSNCRLVKGTAVYTGAFTPPTTPLTAITNTSLLTCQSNRFVDNSTNALAVTVNSTPSVQPFSPFAPSAAYDPSVNGGSGLFGTGNYLTAPDDNAWDLTASTGSIEMFLYSTGIQTNGNGLVGQNSATGDWGGYVYADGRIAIGIQGSSELVTASGNLVDNTWIHVVFTRDNSTGRTRTFVNGVLKATGTGTYFAVSSNPLQIINFNDGVNRSFIGYVADIRFCKGSIPTAYQTASTTVDASIFTPPTAPLTVSSQGANSADTELLLNFTNAGIIDNTGKNNLETVGNAQIDTTTKKYGTGSMEFDGTGDWLFGRNTPQLSFGTGNFTIEAWIYSTARGTYPMIAKSAVNSTWQAGWALCFGFLSTEEKLEFWINGSKILESTNSVSLNAWHHVAVSRSGTSLKMFVDGTEEASATNSTSINTTSPLNIGSEDSGNYGYTGFIDDLRITKGIARYTANFTPPSQAFPNL